MRIPTFLAIVVLCAVTCSAQMPSANSILGSSPTTAAAQPKLGRQSMLEVLAEHPDLEKALEEASKNPQRH